VHYRDGNEVAVADIGRYRRQMLARGIADSKEGAAMDDRVPQILLDYTPNEFSP
jgi:hypothetical protein